MKHTVPDAAAVAPVSVVIATLGCQSLRSTIEHLNKGTLIPVEILISIPEENAHRVDDLDFPNVKVVRTAFRGQVAQRAEGFRRATSPYVLQLDDDIRVRASCLAALVASVAADPRVAAGPKWYDAGTREYHSFLLPSDGGPTWFEKLLYRVINGNAAFQPGAISAAGVNMGLPEFPDTLPSIDWLSGGCLLHRRENLILDDFYPFAGKAWAEDLFHSRLLRAKGIRLMRCGDAACEVDFSSASFPGFLRYVRDHLTYSRRMISFAWEGNRSISRLCCYLMLRPIDLAVRKLGAGRRHSS